MESYKHTKSNIENLLEFKLYSGMNSLMSKFSQVQSESKCDLLPDLKACVDLILNNADPDSLHKNFKINLYQFLCNISSYSSVRLQQLGLYTKTRLMLKLLLMVIQPKNEDNLFNKNFLCEYSHELMNRFGMCISFHINDLETADTSYFSRNILLSIPNIVESTQKNANLLGSISRVLGQNLLIQCGMEDKKAGYSKRASSAPKVPLYTELDGSPARDIMTILTLSSTQSHDVTQSMYTFSILKLWLIYLKEIEELYDSLDFQLNKFTQGFVDNIGSPYAVGGSQFYDDASTDSDSVPSIASSFSSMHSLAQSSIMDNQDDRSLSSSKFTLNESPSISRRKQYDTISITSDILSVASNIRNIVCRYCLRVVQQSEKLPRHKSDKSVVIASTVECIHILDMLCHEDLAISQKVFMEMKRLQKRIEKDPFSNRSIFVALLQFFIHHHNEMLIPIDNFLEKYFLILPDKKYNNQYAVFEFFELCCSNKKFFCCKKDVISKYAPNILKFFVWWPITFTHNMRDILEILITNNNVLEMFHMIIDLPVLAIAMFLKHEKILDSENKLKDFFHGDMKPYFPAMFAYFLRTKSTGVDTIDRLSELFNKLQETQNHPRVNYVSQLVSFLLLEFFDIVYDKEDKDLLKLLYPVILERIFYLYPEYIVEEVQLILCDQLINIAKLVPEVFKLNISDIHSFMNQLQLSRFYHPDFLKKIIWSIGEFASNGSCSHEDVAKLFTTLEAYLSEMMDKIGKSIGSLSNCEVITSLVISLSKLATHSQDLIQQLLMRFSKLLLIPYEKMSEQMSYADFLSIQQLTKQMSKTLRKPNVAESLLSSEKRKQPWHNDEHNSLILKVHMLLNHNKF